MIINDGCRQAPAGAMGASTRLHPGLAAVQPPIALRPLVGGQILGEDYMLGERSHCAAAGTGLR